jgi:hypothetical protein
VYTSVHILHLMTARQVKQDAKTHFNPHWMPHRPNVDFDAGYVKGFVKVLQGISVNS